MTARSTVARDRADARRYRLLRVELVGLRDDLRSRVFGPSDTHLAIEIDERIRRALDRAALREDDAL